MNLKGTVWGIAAAIILLAGVISVASAQNAATNAAVNNRPTTAVAAAKAAVAATNKAAALPEAKPAEVVKTGATLTNQPIQGTVVIKSSSDEAEEETTAETSEAATSGGLVVTKDPATGLLTIDSPGTDIRSVVRKVADLYNLNIVVPENMNGGTTLKLREVTWKQLFEVMLMPVGFSYVEDKNIILIKSREEISAEPTETRVFLVNYATAQELSASITPLIDATNGGRIQVDKRSNGLVITERPSRFNNIKDIIERLDKPTPQVIIESKFIEVTENDATNLGVNWTSLNSYQLTAGPFSRTYTRDSTATDAKHYTDSAVFSAPAFKAILSSLSTLTGSNLVSNPTVVALNNTEAMINIGEEYPIPEYSYNQQQGVFEVSGFSYKPIGINLKVTPQVNSQGFITLNIAPEVSSRTGEVSFGGASGASIPIIATRKTSSTINIKDGYTLAIGGLIETKDNKTTVKVPLLGDIPVAGKLFTSVNPTKDRRNLVIFITARTVNPDGSTKQFFDQRVMTEMGLTDSDLPGYKPNAEEEKLIADLEAKREAYKRQQQISGLEKSIKSDKSFKGEATTSESRARR